MSKHLYVEKRGGGKQEVSFDKILTRITALAENLEVDAGVIAQITISGLHPGVKTRDLDTLAAENAAFKSTIHPDYDVLAAKITISNLQKETSDDFYSVMKQEYEFVHPKTGHPSPQISEETFNIVEKYKDRWSEVIKHERDYDFSFFGIKTLSSKYLCRLDDKIVERPQYLFLRVSIGIHGDNFADIVETYDLMSTKKFTHATPTLYNSGTPRPQMSSCFLATIGDEIGARDTNDGDAIYDILKKVAIISKYAGGIGLSLHDVRAKNSYIAGTNGYSNGIVPMLRVFNDTARYVDQGGGKRKGSFAVYIEPWHADIEDYLLLKNVVGKEERRARDLFYALWVPDLFMERVKNDEIWSLFCPSEAPGLADCWGEKFETLYKKYESEGRFRKQIKARDLMIQICKTQIETSAPYMLYKDACNAKSNQQNLGTIRSSNLCTEIVEYTAPDEIAVCNLASMCLPAYVKLDPSGGPAVFDFESLHHNVKVVTKNLNKIIDRNYYPVKETENSNLRHRPVGIGVQGLADVFCCMRYPYESPEAKELNKKIFATIYHAALEQSCELARVDGSYSSFAGSPASKGILQPDMWNVEFDPMYDWVKLKEEIKQYGLRNSLLVAPMPTASTSQIMGNSECFEPYVSNIYSRKVLAGHFTVVNYHLVKDLIRLNLWDEKMKELIIAHKGSVQYIDTIPEEIKKLYKTAWEIENKCLVDMSADRGAYIDQSQSFSVFIENPTVAKLSSLHNYAWGRRLKTGMYYARSRPAVDPIQFTVDHKVRQSAQNLKRKIKQEENDSKRRRVGEKKFFCVGEEGCEACGS